MQSLEEVRDAALNYLEKNGLLEGFPLQEYEGSDWEQHKGFCNDGYARKCVFSNEKLDVILVCWKPADSTPKHDHPAQGCRLKVLSGELVEVRFAKETTTTRLVAGDDAYIHNDLGYHTLGNQSQKPAISLHLYAPGDYCPKRIS